jgi:ABC-type proline/glycine betaine transport system permease subunit
MEIPEIPFKRWIDVGIDWMSLNLEFLFEPIAIVLSGMRSGLTEALGYFPPYVFIACLCFILIWRRKNQLAVGSALALLLIWNLGFWDDTIITLSLAMLGGGFALLVGIPLGVLIAENKRAYAIVLPILDYMQSTPAFVYLIPWVLFFGVGDAAGIVSIFVWAMPPAVRATEVGLNGVDAHLIEAANAYGANREQLLFKVKLPLAVPHIVVGVNQCIMFATAMAVFAALIGAGGLGQQVVASMQTVDMALGIESGLCVVLMAIVLDRLTKSGVQKGPVS